jgi:hypothetical protein
MEIALILLGLGLAAAAPFITPSQAPRVLRPLPSAKDRIAAWRDRDAFANTRTEEEQLRREARGKVVQWEVWSLDHGALNREIAFRESRRPPRAIPAATPTAQPSNVFPLRRIS